MYKIPSKDISIACFNLGRRYPTGKYLPIVLEIAILSPYFAEEPPKGAFPMSYHTLSYEEDMKRHMRLRELVEKYK